MDIQNLVNTVITGEAKTLGAETITIDGQDVHTAIPAEVDSDRNLDGGSRNQRDIDYSFPTIKALKLRKGQAVKADGKKWKIDIFRKGKAMTTIQLVEPNRKDE